MSRKVVLFLVLLGTAAIPLLFASRLFIFARSSSFYIRVNQVGYLPDAYKIGIAAGDVNLNGAIFTVEEAITGQPVYSGTVGSDLGAWGPFAHHYPLAFTAVVTPGRYRLRLEGLQSPVFTISPNAYAGLSRLPLAFFPAQRCGATEPYGHRPCHLHDAPLSTTPTITRDVTGGWHDAGDYIKFTLTTGYATTLLLLAYRDHPHLFADGGLLKEAKVGLDWLEKMWDPAVPMLYAQVGSEQDHEQGWRLPEDDALDGTPQRPLYPCEDGKGANLAGKVAAAFALAAQIYGDPAGDVYSPTLATHYRALAEAIYAWGKARPAAQPSFPHYFYDETSWRDDMALAAAELYRLTGDASYRNEAHAYAQSAGPGWWWSWETLNGIAHRELALADPAYLPTAIQYLKEDLDGFISKIDNPWGAVKPFVWGSAYPIMGAAIEANWYEELAGDSTYEALAQAQVDFLLGRNPWGVCFLNGAGINWPHDPHHQVAYLGLRPLGKELTGYWAGGPVEERIFLEIGITLAEEDEYAAFQSSQAVFHDDRNDYITNEPSIGLNASGVLLLSLYDFRYPVYLPILIRNRISSGAIMQHGDFRVYQEKRSSLP